MALDKTTQLNMHLADIIITQMDNDDVHFSTFLDLSKTFDTIENTVKQINILWFRWIFSEFT